MSEEVVLPDSAAVEDPEEALGTLPEEDSVGGARPYENVV